MSQPMRACELGLGDLSKPTAPTCLTPKNMLYHLKHVGAVSSDRSPNPGSQARSGWDTYPASLRFSTRKKISSTEVRRTPDEITDQALW